MVAPLHGGSVHVKRSLAYAGRYPPRCPARMVGLIRHRGSSCHRRYWICHLPFVVLSRFQERWEGMGEGTREGNILLTFKRTMPRRRHSFLATGRICNPSAIHLQAPVNYEARSGPRTRQFDVKLPFISGLLPRHARNSVSFSEIGRAELSLFTGPSGIPNIELDLQAPSHKRLAHHALTTAT